MYDILRFSLQTSRKFKGVNFNVKFFMQANSFFYHKDLEKQGDLSDCFVIVAVTSL